jgi:hypothetical protein
MDLAWVLGLAGRVRPQMIENIMSLRVLELDCPAGKCHPQEILTRKKEFAGVSQKVCAKPQIHSPEQFRSSKYKHILSL